MLLLACPDPKQRVECVAFAPDGRTVAGGTHTGVVYLWPATGGPPAVAAEVPNDSRGLFPGVHEIAYSPDGRYLVAGFCSPPGLFVRDLARGANLPVPASPRVTGISPAPDGSGLAWYESVGHATGGGVFRLGRWGDAGLSPGWEWPVREGFSGHLRHFPDGRQLVCVTHEVGEMPSQHGRVAVHAADTGEPVRVLESSNALLGGVVVSPDGSGFVVRAERSLLVWEADAGRRPVRKVTGGTRRHFTGIAYHPAGRHLAATSNDATVKLFDTTTWEPNVTYTWNAGKLRSMAFSPDGLLAAAGTDAGTVVLWDMDL